MELRLLVAVEKQEWTFMLLFLLGLLLFWCLGDFVGERTAPDEDDDAPEELQEDAEDDENLHNLLLSPAEVKVLGDFDLERKNLAIFLDLLLLLGEEVQLSLLSEI
jgi:hypothetical protein